MTRSGARATVYVSWNGATEIERWRVLGGADPTELVLLGTADTAGFETEITVRDVPPYLAVQALDGARAVLGVSRVVRGVGAELRAAGELSLAGALRAPGQRDLTFRNTR